MKIINQLDKNQLRDKKILLRVDFDVPLTQSPITNHQLPIKIGESFRIKAQKETVDYLIGAGAKVLMIGHVGHEISDASFGPVVEELGEILGQTITLVPHLELSNVDVLFEASPLLLLENIRQDPREMENNDDFAAELAKGSDYYVNDAFAVMHRNHASVVAITKYLPSYAGFLIKKEIENLGQAMKAPVGGKILLLGGAKISTKLPVIKNFLDKAEKILIGGALANNFFKMQGIEIGRSLVDTDEEGKTQLDLINLGSSQDPRWDQKIILPEDVLISDDKTGKSGAEPYPIKDISPDHLILDIGPETAKYYTEIISRSKMVIWNGPMGLFEVDVFAEGTRVVAEAVALATASIIGGGDTIAAVNKLGLLGRYGFVSTGGGAMLEFLAGSRLPGLEALGYYD